MNRMKFVPTLVIAALMALTLAACDDPVPNSDQVAHKAQEASNQEAARQVGFPNIVNYREKRMLKTIFELRDQADYITYSYVFAENTGKFTFFCKSIGYPVPYATQYTNPEVAVWQENHGYLTLPQADPNSLFSPGAADGTWVLCANTQDPKAKPAPVYVEPKVTTLPFKLPDNVVTNP